MGCESFLWEGFGGKWKVRRSCSGMGMEEREVWGILAGS
jgi:hypothetical protein